MTERSAETFRLMGINYVDQAGNAFIAFDGVHIDVRGRRASSIDPKRAPTSTATRGGVNLFSPKRSQVIFATLSWENVLDGPIRQLAQVAGVSLGQAQETLDLLERYGLLDERRHFIRSRRGDLIDLWTAAFPSGLRPHVTYGSFSGSTTDLSPVHEPMYLSGEAAVPSRIRPETVVLYSRSLPMELIREHQWRLDDEYPNIFIRRQYWNPPQTELPGTFEAPWLLVYADLMASNESRQLEAAQHIRSLHD